MAAVGDAVRHREGGHGVRVGAGDLDRNLALELVRATEAAAINYSGYLGFGDKNRATTCCSRRPGVTDGALRGVRFEKDRVVTQSLSMRSKSGTVRLIEGRHDPERSLLVNIARKT